MNIDERAGRKSWNGRPDELADILERAAAFVREHPKVKDMTIAILRRDVVLVIFFDEEPSL
jgi:hypothetical protein